MNLLAEPEGPSDVSQVVRSSNNHHWRSNLDTLEKGIDFDHVEKHNLDHLSYAARADIGRLKVEVMADHLVPRATAVPFRVESVPTAVYGEEVSAPLWTATFCSRA